MTPRFSLAWILSLAMMANPGAALAQYEKAALPKGFVYLDEIVPTIQLEFPYFTEHNFVGRRIAGYEAAKCIISRPAAEALKKVQDELQPFGLGLKVFDAYRPQLAVDHFVQWAKDPQDTKTKASYYPNLPKQDLMGDYIAARSSHSRGSTVDLTLVSLTGEALDMGSSFDLFDKKSWTLHSKIPPAQRAHRMLLRNLMTRHGFKPYAREWWHFTLVDEPFPETYFDFPVR